MSFFYNCQYWFCYFFLDFMFIVDFMVLIDCLCCIAMEMYTVKNCVLIVKIHFLKWWTLRVVTMHQTNQLFVCWLGNLKKMVHIPQTRKSLDALEVAEMKRMLLLCSINVILEFNSTQTIIKKHKTSIITDNRNGKTKMM